MCSDRNGFPNDFDCIIIGTSLVESMVAASLAVTGSYVLHIDRHPFYGCFGASLRFADMLRFGELWSSPNVPNDGEQTITKDLNLTVLNKALIRNFSSGFRLPEIATESNSKEPCPDQDNDSTKRIIPPKWTKNILIDNLKRTDFDILPRVLFSESPIVNALIRSDVSRYVEFLAVNRLLYYNPAGVDDRIFTHTDPKVSESDSHQSTSISSLLVKVPVSRGDVFRTRILSLSQKRLLVGFLEWCANLSESVSTIPAEDKVYLEKPLLEYLQQKRSLDPFISRIVVNCLAFSDDSITLKDALPRFQRLISSMNRVCPFPLLWPQFGCGELPQSFCRMCAVFSGTYCLNRTVSAVYGTNSDDFHHRRQYCAHLSTGEEVFTSCLLIGAEQAPTDWVLPQIHRWIARAILVTTGSIFPSGHDHDDITLMPMQLDMQSKGPNELAFLLETPVEPRNGKTNLYVIHLTAACDTCVDAAVLFTAIIDRLYPTDATLVSQKPQVLWNCFFTIPDLSNVTCHGLASEYGLEEDGILVAPGFDTSMLLDRSVNDAEKIFLEVSSLIHQKRTRQSADSPQNESMPPSSISGASVLSLEQLWDGVFPPQPPKPEDLIFTEEQEASSTLANDDPSSKANTNRGVLLQDETESNITPTAGQ
ncbi:hypothetical protein Aperf_G00000047432 [Anoplocephala perfoliata]